MTAPAPTVTPELKQVLRRLKLGKMLETLPERLLLAKTNKLVHAGFLKLILADEIDRRDRTRRDPAGPTAGHDKTMTLESWDDHDAIAYDHDILVELAALRFVEDHQCAFTLGPVGVGKTHLAHALGHVACRRQSRARRTRRPAVQAAQSLKAGQQPRPRDPSARRRRSARHRGESFRRWQKPVVTTTRRKT